MFFVYILQNKAGRFYIGQTSDLQARLSRHNENLVTWTRNRGPWQIVFSRQFPSRSEAMTEEKRLKRLKSKTALEALIKSR
jgi:putative endonuclease